ncbi:MAG: MipA/OmpV family protein [Burkholderiales bacterium]|nr:MipA/OmpV family protein [Burkholderiales bacterium]MDE2564441.1 MipA/OmpV family protein [Burkholderiales bacterium]
MVAAAALSAGAAGAQERPSSPGWQTRVGAGVVAGPRSIGADKSRLRLVPSFDLRYGDWFFANPIEGIGVQSQTGAFSASAALAPDLYGRDPDAGPRFRGLSRVSPTAAARFRLGYAQDGYTASAVVSSRLGSSRRRGTTLQWEAGYDFVQGPAMHFNAGLTLTAMDSTFARNLLSVSAAEAAASGLPVYSAGSGMLDAGLYGQVLYRIDERWSVFSRLQVSRLEGDAAKAPFVVKRTAPSFVVFVDYALAP